MNTDKSLEALQLSSSHVITDTIHGVCDFITLSSAVVYPYLVWTQILYTWYVTA